MGKSAWEKRRQRVKILFQEHTLFLLLLPIATLTRIYKLGEKQLWVDEIIQAIHSSPNSLKEILLGVRGEVAATPLDFMIQHSLMTLLGRSEFSVRLHAALFGILTVVVLYHATQIIFHPRVAKIASLLYAVYPLHHHYSQEGRPYALFVLLVLCSYLAFLKLLLKRKTIHWLYYTSVSVVLFYAHYYALLVLLSQLLFLCFMLSPKVQESFPPIRKVDLVFFCKFLASVGISVILFVPWIIFAFTSTQGHMPEHFGWKLLFRSLKELGDRSYPLSFLLIFFAIFGILKLTSEEKYGPLLFLLVWFLFPIPCILFMIWLRDYFLAIRQFLFITPALFILVSYGILHFSETSTKANDARRSKAMALLVSLVVLISGIGIFSHIPDKREDLKAAGRFLKRNVSKGDIVIAPELTGVLSYYFPDIYTHSQDIQALQNLNDFLVSGRKIYIVKSRHMPASDRSMLDDVRGRTTNYKTLNFRGVEIILFGHNGLTQN